MRAAFDGRWVRDTTAACEVAHSATNAQRAKSKEQCLLFIEKILLCRFIYIVLSLSQLLRMRFHRIYITELP